MAGHNAVGTPSGPRRCSADGKIALGLQSQTSVRQAASAMTSLKGEQKMMLSSMNSGVASNLLRFIRSGERLSKSHGRGMGYLPAPTSNTKPRRLSNAGGVSGRGPLPPGYRSSARGVASPA
jgi:hypothetical protein